MPSSRTVEIQDKHYWSGAVMSAEKGRVVLLPDPCLICGETESGCNMPVYEETDEYAVDGAVMCKSCSTELSEALEKGS